MRYYDHPNLGRLVAGSAFRLFNAEMQDTIAYPRDWLSKASPEWLAAHSFTVVDVAAPVVEPPVDTPETTPLTREQLFLALMLPQPSGLGLTDADIGAMIDKMPAHEAMIARIRLSQGDRFHWDNPLMAGMVRLCVKMHSVKEDQVRAAWMAASNY